MIQPIRLAGGLEDPLTSSVAFSSLGVSTLKTKSNIYVIYEGFKISCASVRKEGGVSNDDTDVEVSA